VYPLGIDGGEDYIGHRFALTGKARSPEKI